MYSKLRDGESCMEDLKRINYMGAAVGKSLPELLSILVAVYSRLVFVVAAMRRLNVLKPKSRTYRTQQTRI